MGSSCYEPDERGKTMGSRAKGKCTSFKIRVKWCSGSIMCGSGIASVLLLSHDSSIDCQAGSDGVKSNMPSTAAHSPKTET